VEALFPQSWRLSDVSHSKRPKAPEGGINGKREGQNLILRNGKI
jgi:hypothetical protein